MGAAGVGKSDSVRQKGKEIENGTGKEVKITDVRLMLFNPVDLRGVPVADKNREFTNWLKPKIFDMKENVNVVNILFLDELSAAPQSVQAAAYQICLDRQIGEHKLPENCIVIAAGNRTTDHSVSYRMPKALCNRLLHFNVKSDYGSWREWAIKNGIDKRIIGYLGFDNTKLCVEPQSNDMAYPTPRSWMFCSNILKAMNEPMEELHYLLSGCIGIDTAVEFATWCQIYQSLPSMEEILKGKNPSYPKKYDVLYALVSSLVSVVEERKNSISMKELENVCCYAKFFPADFAAMFFDDLRAIEGMQKQLMKCRAMQEWIGKSSI